MKRFSSVASAVLIAGLLWGIGAAGVSAQCGCESCRECGCGDCGCDEGGCNDCGCSDGYAEDGTALYDSDGAGGNGAGAGNGGGGGGFDGVGGSFGVTGGALASAPNMIGDFFANGQTIFGVPNPIAAGDRRLKLFEDNNPFPRDRIFFNYSHFNNALPLDSADAVDVNRYTFGVEKTFLNEITSVELRVPFASGIQSDQDIDVDSSGEIIGAPDGGVEFGNISLAFKLLMFENDWIALASGLMVTLPTAEDAVFTASESGGPTTDVRVTNDVVYLQPFVGVIATPTDRTFAQLVVGLDFDAGGYRVFVGDGFVARAFNQNLLFIDATAGFWLHRNPCGHWITGIAPVVELHYATSISDPDGVSGIVVQDNDLDVLNLVGGIHFQIAHMTTLTVAGGAPVHTNTDFTFDSEFSLRLNRRF